jgi:sugar phosphate isomerase/epimerase
MKLSCLPVSWFSDILSGRMPLEEWMRFAARLGLDAIDFTVLFLEDKDTQGLDDLRETMLKYNLQLCMLACYSDFTHPDAAERSRQVEEMMTNIQTAARLGASLIRVTAGQRYPGVDREQGVEWAIQGLQQVLPEAECAGVTLAYENHTKGAPWQYWDFSQPAEIFLEILDGMAGTSLGVNYDTANALVSNEDPITLLEAVKDRVVSVHAADVRAPGALEPVVLGTGVAPFPEIFSILKSDGFDGWICIEEASRTGPIGFEQAVAFVRQAWQVA